MKITLEQTENNVALSTQESNRNDIHQPALDVWSTDIDLPIESTGPHQRGVQNIDTIRCRKNHDTRLRSKTWQQK